MSETATDVRARGRRADAVRNRAAILSAAAELYAERGVEISMDGVAVAAGVSNATLYRNFATRDDLLVEMMRDGIAELLGEARQVAATSAPREALDEWLFRLTWHLRTWHGMPGRVVDALADPDSPMRLACAPLQDWTADLMAAAVSRAQVSAGTSPGEVFELATLLSWGIDRYGDTPERARRRVQTAFAGLLAGADPQ